MTELLKPEGSDQILAALDRRLSILEATARVGLNRVRFAWGTSSNFAITTPDVWESGPAGRTWADSGGASGTGYPEVTMETGKKVGFLCIGLPQAMANDPGYKCGTWLLGIGIDGGDPFSWATPTRPKMYRFQSHGPTTEGTHPNIVMVGRSSLTPGIHTFKIWAYWQTRAGGAIMPYVDDPQLVVIPID